MKNIRLNKLALRDFQGGTFTLDAQGSNVDISGDNGVGKTRLVSAFTWLLFDKDSLGRSDFEIKNLDSQGQASHGLEHSVEGTLDVDGKPITFKKVFKEIWTKKRGATESTFSGHTTEYFIDGVPVQKKDYMARIAEVAGDESQFRLLTSPTAFASLPPLPTSETIRRNLPTQRGMLITLCGDIADLDVIACDDKLAALPGILNGRKLDDHKKVIASRRTEINKELERIPVRIDEQRRSLPDVTGLDKDALHAEQQRLETAVNDAKLRLQGVDTGGAIAEHSKTLAGINTDLQSMENKHRSGSLSTLNRLNQQISEVTEKVGAARRRMTVIDGDIKSKDKQVQGFEADLDRLRARWTAIDAEHFQDSTPDTCAACGQSLPADKVQAARDKALAAFNSDKADKLAGNESQGRTLAEQKTRLASEIANLREERQGIEIRLPDTEAEVMRLTTERDALKATSEDFSSIPGRSELLTRKAEVEAQITAARSGAAQDSEKIRKEITAMQSEWSTVTTKHRSFAAREQGEARIEELKADEKRLAQEFERLEQELYLCEQFIRTKVKLLTERINSRFELVRFKLFNTQINGGLEECCEITVNGVPYNSGLNNAARINAGLDVCRTLSEHFGILAPVFVDNAESVSHLIDMKSQVIRLIVSERDKVLRIHATEQAAAA